MRRPPTARAILRTPAGEAFLLAHAERMGQRFNAAVLGGSRWAPSGSRMVAIACQAFEIRRRRRGHA